MGYLPAYTDRHEFFRFSGLVAIQPGLVVNSLAFALDRVWASCLRCCPPAEHGQAEVGSGAGDERVCRVQKHEEQADPDRRHQRLSRAIPPRRLARLAPRSPRRVSERRNIGLVAAEALAQLGPTWPAWAA